MNLRSSAWSALVVLFLASGCGDDEQETNAAASAGGGGASASGAGADGPGHGGSSSSTGGGGSSGSGGGSSECPRGSGGGGAGNVSCQAWCEIAHSLACPNEPADDSHCTAQCEALGGGVPWCLAQGQALVDCIASDPANYFCGESGADFADGVCPGKTGDAAACWCLGEAATRSPDVTCTCQAYCAAVVSLPCAMTEADCVADCTSSTALGLFGQPALLATVACAATQPLSSFECDSKGEVTLTDAPACSKAVTPVLACFVTQFCACNTGQACATDCEGNLCQDLPVTDACRTCMLANCYGGS